MSILKIITTVNWVLISVYGGVIVWVFLQQANPYNDAGGGEMETALKGLAAFMLVVLIGLNLLAYSWTKVAALLLVLSLLLLVRYIATH
ncbi:hypothetical protein [Spirosoma aerophilum]